MTLLLALLGALRILSIGDCTTGDPAGTDEPQGPFYWTYFPDLLGREMRSLGRGAPGAAMFNWGLTDEQQGDGGVDLFPRLASPLAPIDFLVVMLGGHDVRLDVSIENFTLAVEQLQDRAWEVLGAQAVVFVLLPSVSPVTREGLPRYFEVLLAACAADERVFCTEDLRDDFTLDGGDYGPRLHLHGEAHRRIAGRIAETLRLLVPPIERRVQSSAQQACINTLNKNFTKVATAQERAVGICLRNHAKGNVSAETCIAAPNSRVEVAKRRTNAAEAKKCTAETPDFGATDADTVNDAAVRVATGVVFDIFGPEPDAFPVTEAANRTFARCQQAVAREVSRCRATKIKEFNRCVKASLKAKTLQSTLDLQTSQTIDASRLGK